MAIPSPVAVYGFVERKNILDKPPVAIITAFVLKITFSLETKSYA